MKSTQKKISFQSVAFGCTMLSAMLTGAWFLFPLEEVITERLPFLTPASQPAERKPELVGTMKVAMPEKTSEPLKGAGDNQPSVHFEEPQEQPEQLTEESLLPDITELEHSSTPEEVAEKKTGQVLEAKSSPSLNCGQQIDRLQGILKDIENQEYIKKFGLKQPVPKYFNSLAAKLASARPTVIRETDDLYTVISNTAHFFRILGKENIRLVKNILNQEKGRLEDIAAGLYAVVNNQCSSEAIQIKIPLETAYEYAGFFLNTMGGRSYLFRREAKARLVATYYAILILDEANRKKQNSYGIDIREMLPRLIGEIEATNQLAGKEEYLDTLYRLEEKYPLE